MEDKQKKILWIDDDVNKPELSCDRDALEERGCIITSVINPDNIPHESISQFDCIIIDLFLPVGEKMSLTDTQFGSITGFISLKNIITHYPKSKIVVYSMFEFPDVRAYCKDNGIHYWNKFEHRRSNDDESDDDPDWSDEFAKDIIKVINGEEV